MGLDIAATITIGAALMGTFVPNVDRAKGLVRRIGDSLDTLRKRHKELNESVKRYSKEQSEASQKSLNDARRQLDLVNKRISALKQEKAVAKRLGESYEEGKQRFKKSVVHIGATVALTKNALDRPMRAAIEHESDMLGVVKQMDGLRDEKTKQFTDKYYQVEEAIWDMSERLPIAVGRIRGMFESAGQMGIKEKEQAEPFVFSVGKTAVALELDQEQAAKDLAQLSTIYQIPPQEIEHRMADVINYLSDNSVATGSQLINILKRMGGSAKFANMPERDSVALAALMMSVSTSEEVAATAANALIRELSVADMQPTRFQEGLKSLGLEAKGLKSSMAVDPTGTIIDVLTRLSNANEEDRATISTKLFGKEYGDDIAKVAINPGRFVEFLNAANNRAARGSIQREFETKQDSLEYKLQRMNNQLERFNANIGQAFIGPVGDIVEWISKAGKWLAFAAKEYSTAFKLFVYAGSFVLVGAILAKISTAIYGFGQAVIALGRTLGKSVGFMRSQAKGIEGIEDNLLPPEERRAAARRRRLERARGLGRSYGRARAAVGGATNAASIGLWGRGASVLDRLSGAWRRAGSAARVAGRGFGSAFRLLGRGVRGVFSILRFSPFGLVLTMMDTALTMIRERWDSFRWFWDEIKAAATDFQGTMESIGEAIGYNWARTKVSDKIEEWMNRRQGIVPERADAPVITKRDLENMVPPPPPPDLQALSQRARTINDHSTTTVNVTQQPDEESRAFAQRVAEEIRRARAARLRGAMYDPVGAF